MVLYQWYEYKHPTETTLEEKLWGTREELHSTGSFIEETSIKVEEFGMRKMTTEEEEEECQQ